MLFDKILWNAANTAHQMAVNLAQHGRVLLKQCFAEVRHLCDIPERSQCRSRSSHSGDIFVL